MAYSPAPLALDRAKPSPWNVEQAFVSPGYQGLWRGIVSLIPLWEASSDFPADVLNGIADDNPGPAAVWQIDEFGVAFTNGGSSTNPSRPIWNEWVTAPQLYGADGITCIVFGYIAPFAGDGAHFEYYDDRTAETSLFAMREGGVDDLAFFVNISGTAQQSGASSQYSNNINDYRFVVGRWRSGGNISAEVYTPEGDLVNQATSGPFSGTIDTPTDPEFMFNAGGTLQRGSESRHIWFATWNRRLSDEDLNLLFADPFGLFRPNWDYLTAGGVSFPSAPTNLTATAVSTSQINLSWDAVSGAGGYDVERDGSVISADQAGTTYNDTGLNTGQSYDYRVRAVS